MTIKGGFALYLVVSQQKKPASHTKNPQNNLLFKLQQRV